MISEYSFICNLSMLQQSQSKHRTNSHTQSKNLQQITAFCLLSLIFENMLPDIGSNIDKIACDEHHDVCFSDFAHVHHSQAYEHANEGDKIYDAITEHGLNFWEWATKEDCNIT